MKLFLLGIFLAVSSLAALSIHDNTALDKEQEIFNKALHSVVKIQTKDATGTGFAVKVNNEVVFVTNSHVCGEDPHPKLALQGDDFKEAQVLKLGSLYTLDLCILRAYPLPDHLEYLKLRILAPPTGERVYTIGYPLNQFLTPTSGLYLGTAYDIGLPFPVMISSNTSYFGNSGSPTLDSNGEVVGVATLINDYWRTMSITAFDLFSFLRDIK